MGLHRRPLVVISINLRTPTSILLFVSIFKVKMNDDLNVFVNYTSNKKVERVELQCLKKQRLPDLICTAGPRDLVLEDRFVREVV